jgi:hypothetical protein
LSSRLAVKRTSLLLSAVVAALGSAALVAAPAAGGGGGGSSAGGGARGGGGTAGAGHASFAGRGRPSPGSLGAGQQGAHESGAETANAVHHITVEGKPAVTFRLDLDRPLKPDDERRLRSRGFIKSGKNVGPNNSPLFCSHSLYQGERQCVWFPPGPAHIVFKS